MKVLWDNLRSQRNIKLAETDKTQLPDFPIDTKLRTQYKEYRKYLRDLPSQYKDDSVGSSKVLDFNSWLSFKGVASKQESVNHKSHKFIKFRVVRDAYLKQTDWTQLADNSLNYEQRQSYRSYRDYLRVCPKLWNDQNIDDNMPASYEEWKNGKI